MEAGSLDPATCESQAERDGKYDRPYEIGGGRRVQKQGARDGDTTVFVEVKARRGSSFGEALDAIPGWKRRRIGAMALDYLAWTGRLNDPCRFDVVAIDGAGGPNPSVQIIEHAFDF